MVISVENQPSVQRDSSAILSKIEIILYHRRSSDTCKFIDPVINEHRLRRQLKQSLAARVGVSNEVANAIKIIKSC